MEKNDFITSQKYLLNCEKSREALKDIIQSFKVDMNVSDYFSNYGDNFNDNFAGVYFDEQGYLNFCTVGIDTLNVGKHTGQVIHRKYKYSYNYLRSIQEAIIPLMIKYGICGVGIDTKGNQITIDFWDAKYVDELIEFLKNKGIYHDGILKIKTGIVAVLA